MQTVVEAVPTLEEIQVIVSQYKNEIGSGCYRTVYRKGNSKWVVKVDSQGIVNQREYDNYLSIRPSLSNPSLRLPEMHMVGRYLVAEYIDGKEGDRYCWDTSIDYFATGDYKAYYTKGCRNDSCTQGDNCWAELTKEISRQIADIHYSNVMVKDGIVYIIDLGEH